MHGNSSWAITPEKILTRYEVESILDRVRRHKRDYVIFCVAANLGLRISEIVHLRLEEFNGDSISVVRRKKKIFRPQSIHIPSALTWIIGEWIGSRDSGFLFPGRSLSCFLKRKDGQVVKLCDGGHVSMRVVQRRWELILNELGIKQRGRGIHTLRHYAITQFYSRHKDLRAAQLYAGHSNCSMTEVYAHVIDLKEKVQAIEATV